MRLQRGRPVVTLGLCLGAAALVAAPWIGVLVVDALEARAWARQRAPLSCDEARTLAAQLHRSAAFHCGCLACRSWRDAFHGGRR